MYPYVMDRHNDLLLGLMILTDFHVDVKYCIHLDEVSNKERYDRVTVNAKVLMVLPKAQISDGLWKQDVHIADSTTSTKLILFENKIDSLVKGETYKFENILVNEFQREKYL